MPTIKKPKKRNNNRKKHGLQAKIQRLIYNTSHWRNLVKVKKMMNPLCERCLEIGKITPCEEVHHIIPISRAIDEMQILEYGFDISNLRSLCCACHELTHQELKRGIAPHSNKKITP